MTLDAATAAAMADMPSTLPPAPQVQPILVSVQARRAKGKALLIIDARQFHAYLDRIGVERGPDGTFRDAPRDGYGGSGINNDRNRVSYGALLKPQGPHEFDIAASYGATPSAEVIRSIADSVETVMGAIIDHYRPIEISVIIHAKAGK